MLTLISELGSTTREALSSHLGWHEEVVERLWQKLKSADLVRDESAFGRENPIRLSTHGTTMIAALGFPGPESLLERILQSSRPPLISVVGELGFGKSLLKDFLVERKPGTRELVIRAREGAPGEPNQVSRTEDVVSDEELARRMRQGDEAAWDILVRRYKRPIFGLCWRSTGNTADAEEMTQEVWTRMWESRGTIRDGGFVARLLMITRNLSIDHARKAQHRRETPLDEAGLEEPEAPAPTWLDESEWAQLRQSHPKAPAQSAAHQEEEAIVGEALRAALDNLGQREVRVLTLWLEGMTMGEIAKTMSITPARAAHIHYRAIRRLRDMLAGRLEKREPLP